MESPQILVTGLPDGTTKYDFIIYFQSERDSGGSDVKEVSEIERGQAIIIFSNPEVASKVSRKAIHYIKGSEVTVFLLPVLEGTDLKRDSSRDDRSKESEHHGAINNPGIEQSDHNNKIQGTDASASPPSHDRTASKILQNRKSPLKQCTVKVKGLPAEVDEETLLHYFENAKRSNGGPVSQISDINRELQTCLITFENPDDAARTVEHSPHHLDSFRLDLSLLEKLEDDVPSAFGEKKRKYSTDETEVIITVSGKCLPPEEDLWDYFENQRRSGGGKVLSIDYTDEGDAVVTFAEVKDLKRLLKPDSHCYDGNPITVVRQPPKKKVPLDPVRVHVQGLKAGVIIKPDNVQNYLEKFCDVYVTAVHFGCDNNALVVFDAEPDFAALFHKVSKDTIGLKGSKPELKRVPLCTCIHVTGLSKETPELTIELYFDNEKRSGGSNVSSVEKIGENEALVYFEDSASVTNVINQGKNHTLGNLALEVKPHYPFIDYTARNKSEITCDPELFDYIKEDHGSEFQALLDENEMELFLEFDTPIVTVSSNAKKKVSYNSWQEKMGRLESFLQGFMKKPIQIPSEIFDEVVNRWENQPSVTVLFDDDRRLAHIIGKSKQVEKETNRLQELIREIKDDTDLMESITKVDIPGIPKSRLTLLQMSGICEKLESEHQHLKISFEENGQRLCLKGPRILHNEVKVKVLAFTSKVIEQAVPLSTNKIKVLKKITVFDYLHSLLKQRGIQALFVYDRSKTSSSNEVQVVGDCPRSVEEATVVLQNEIQERSLHLTKENAVVLECRSWTDFHSDVTSNFKVEMFTESPSSTVCVSGIAEDVKECFEQVKQFLDANTILRNSLPLDQGTTRFIIQKWGSKLARIKTALATCFVEIKPASNYDGIEVSGTAEGLEKCLPRLQELVKAVQKDSVSIERPGMKKYILHEKGPEELKSIEDNNQCIIVVKESKNRETSLTIAGAEGFSGMLSSKSLSSYSLEEEEKSPMLDDADAIVNPDHTETATLFMHIKKPKLAAFNSGATPHTTPMKATLRSSPNIRITVINGDLSKEKADILVGTAASSLNLEQNPCAKALKNAAGPTLQQECTKNGPVRSGDIAVINQTGSPPQWGLQCRTVIFAICPPWNGGQGKEALKGLLTKCLEEADLTHMTSIAFAAIGTGNLQFPRDQVAEIYFDEVNSYNQKHPSTSLKDVRFVLHDTPTFQAFQAAERAKQNSGQSGAAGNGTSLDGSTTFSPVRERTPDHLETTVGPLCFQAQQGSITKETTEAIAIISNSELDISASGTGAAILKEGGSAIATECSRHAPRTPGSVFVSTAGNLKAGHLYHIVPRKFPLTPDSLQASVLKCLQEAELRGRSSISFPAIGTGNLGITAKDCTRAVLTAVRELSIQNPKSLKLVKMTVFQKSMMKDVRSAMSEVSGMKPLEETGAVRNIFEKGLKKVAGIVSRFGGKEERPTAPTTNRELDNKKVDLVIFAGCESDLQKALKAVSEMMAENSKQQRIREETIKSLTEDDMRIIHTLELKYSVEMNVKKEVGCIVIDGLSDDIRQVVGEVHEMLHRVEKRCHAEMISKGIQWKRKTKEKFEEYESHLNAQIEFAFHQSKPYVIIRRDEEKYKIVFDGWTEHDEYGNITEVRRIDLRKDVEFPVEWAPQPADPQTGREETVYVYQLDPMKDAQEYKRVSDKFHQSCTNNIMKIERVQNPRLYGTYAFNKQKMDKAKVRGSNEMCLFHGTKGPNCEQINHKGFNRSFCGENAVCFGNDVYFAANASYSARSKYSPPDDKGNRYMYLARVLVGEYTVGKEGMMVPPAKNSNNLTDTYDTVVNDVSNPSIYVVFYDWQCYPEYLITFQ